jgi:hypothetical protein
MLAFLLQIKSRKSAELKRRTRSVLKKNNIMENLIVYVVIATTFQKKSISDQKCPVTIGYVSTSFLLG